MASRCARSTVPPPGDGRRWRLPRSRCASCFTNSWTASNPVRANRAARFPYGGMVFGLVFAAIGPAMGQPVPAAEPLTVGQAVQRAPKNYPSVRVSQEQISAAAAGVRLARTAYLPHADALAQVNRATRNNVYGLLLPQSTLPSMSGPVLGTNNLGTAWGTALGMLVTWEPFDFGLRRANVAVAGAQQAESAATLKRTEYEIAVATADAWLSLAAAQETVRAAQAGVDRAGILLRTITAQVNAQLRPGADASRADAEVAAARTQWIQAQQADRKSTRLNSSHLGISYAVF